MVFLFIGMDEGMSTPDDSVVIQVESDEFNKPPETKQELEQALHQTQANAYAKGTLKICYVNGGHFIGFM